MLVVYYRDRAFSRKVNTPEESLNPSSLDRDVDTRIGFVLQMECHRLHHINMGSCFVLRWLSDLR